MYVQNVMFGVVVPDSDSFFVFPNSDSHIFLALRPAAVLSLTFIGVSFFPFSYYEYTDNI